MFSETLGCLYRKHKGQTCLIMAAGPSIEKQIELIKTLKGKITIIAVDKACSFGDYIADYVVTVDGKPEVGTFWQRPKTKKLHMITPLGISCVRNWAGDITRCNRDLKKKEIPMPSFVGIAAIEIAIKIGFEKIICVGYDLGFTGNKRYAFMKEENEKELEQIRGITFFNYIEYGTGEFKLIYTMPGLLAQVKLFTKYLFEKKVINCTEGGLLRTDSTLEKVIKEL